MSVPLGDNLTAAARLLPLPDGRVVHSSPRPGPASPVLGGAIVVLGPGTGLADHAPALPVGWTYSFANATLPGLLHELFGEARLTWPAAVFPAGLAPAAPPLPGGCEPIFAGRESVWTVPPRVLDQPSARGQGVVAIVNGRQFPLFNLSEALRRHRQNHCDVTLIDVGGAPAAFYDEKLELGNDGHVRQIGRRYGKPWLSGPGADVHWPALLIISRRAMMQLGDMPLPLSLALWPAMMLRAGLRLHGSTMPGRCFDLAERSQVQELAHALLRQRRTWLCRAGGLRERLPDMLIGRHVRIDRTARLIGPLAIGDGVEIGPNALVIGPAVIGCGTRIASGAVLRRGVLPQDSILPPCAPPEVASPSRTNHTPRAIRLENVLGGPTAAAPKGLDDPGYRIGKRAIDLLGSILFLALTLPFYPLIVVAIRLSSPGPVFYGHPRQGKGGKTFRCWKFRTMVPNADQIKAQLAASNEVDGPQFKIKDDPRIFPFGRLLRRLNIDEWPQVFNVLAGEMSLVGPRPSPERENQLCPAWREARLSVLPGVTGLWQVLRRREKETDFQEWIYYDVQYVKHQSIWLDLKILLWTLRVMLHGR